MKNTQFYRHVNRKLWVNSLQLEVSNGSRELVRENNDGHFFHLSAFAVSAINAPLYFDIYNCRNLCRNNVFHASRSVEIQLRKNPNLALFLSKYFHVLFRAPQRCVARKKNLHLCRFGAFENPQCRWAP